MMSPSLAACGGRLHAKSVAYAATSLGAGLIHPVFSFYYVKIYLNRFHVTEEWFQTAQLIFLVWNAINDPLFGCLQDNVRWMSALRSRRHSILYGAPLFVLSFVVLWFPWADYGASASTTTAAAAAATAVEPPSAWIAGVQLTVALCFYDALFTFVLLAQCALFAELSVDQTDRVRLVRYQNAASLLGSVSVLICESTSDGLRDFGRFQATCVALGLAAGVCFVYTGLNAQTPFDRQRLAEVDVDMSQSQQAPKPASTVTSDSETMTWRTVLRQTSQIFAQPSFISFVLMNLLQVFHMTFISNFANIIGDRLLGTEHISPATKSLLFGSMFIIPQLVVIVGAPLATSFGYYRLVRGSFMLNIAMGIWFMIVGHQHVGFVAAFFLIESASVSATFSLFNLCLSDIVDVDTQQHRRRHPLSSMVFGLNALVTKPGQSLAPMMTVAVLTRFGYSSSVTHQLLPTVLPSVGLPTGPPASVILPSSAVDGMDDDDPLTAAMFYTACLVPVACGLAQLVLWRFYTIRESNKPGYQLVFTAN